ncbi:MAG: FAD-binding oxidoreductase [Pseudomonadota bacterium]
MLSHDLLDNFISIVGRKHARTKEDDLTHYTHENRNIVVGDTPLVLKPGSTLEVSQIVKLAQQTGTAIVPQGGHTGHAGGGVPDESGTQIVIAMERMNKIREIDLKGNVIICEAGCVLETLQETASTNDRLFPLSLGSQGSCQIGGNIGTNAGGTGVLAYGNTRNLVMGLEVVLPNGDIWNGLRRLKKDNSGYDLKDLFIGSEGTLGIVTAAVLKLFPKPTGQSIAICGLESAHAAVDLLNLAQANCGEGLTAFELMAEVPMEFTFRNFETVKNPLSQLYPWHVLIEVSSIQSQQIAEDTLQSTLEYAHENSLLADAAVSNSVQQFRDFWGIREIMPTAQGHEGVSMKHDISLPIHRIPEFLQRADTLVLEAVPGARLCTFGHLGDGNLHYNISQPLEMASTDFKNQLGTINNLVHTLVMEMDGSIAAEHGVGRLKRDLLADTKDEVELELMRSIKSTIDPNGIMNPGKIVG